MSKDKVANPVENLPKFATLSSKGKCRVVGYTGRGIFLLLDKDDQQIRVHRRECRFTNK